MFDLFKSDYAPIESFSNIEFEKKFKDNVDRIIYKDPYSDERNNNNNESELANEYIPPEKKPEPGTSRIESINTKNSKKEAPEAITKDIKVELDEVYTNEKFGKEIVCNCGVDVNNAADIIQEVSKKAIMLDKIVSNLKKDQRECVLTKINKLKLSQYPGKVINDEPVVSLKEPTKKEVEMVTSDKKLKVKVNNKQVEEEQGEIYNISHDIFSNEMIIIAVIIAIVILCMN